jgi:hypothetical protein
MNARMTLATIRARCKTKPIGSLRNLNYLNAIGSLGARAAGGSRFVRRADSWKTCGSTRRI